MPTKAQIEVQRNAQGYSLDLPSCGRCAHIDFDKVLPAWMQRDGRGWADSHKQEKNHRCKIGGFPVKKTATCRQWAPIIVTNPETQGS